MAEKDIVKEIERALEKKAEKEALQTAEIARKIQSANETSRRAQQKLQELIAASQPGSTITPKQGKELAQSVEKTMSHAEASSIAVEEAQEIHRQIQQGQFVGSIRTGFSPGRLESISRSIGRDPAAIDKQRLEELRKQDVSTLRREEAVRRQQLEEQSRKILQESKKSFYNPELIAQQKQTLAVEQSHLEEAIARNAPASDIKRLEERVAGAKKRLAKASTDTTSPEQLKKLGAEAQGTASELGAIYAAINEKHRRGETPEQTMERGEKLKQKILKQQELEAERLKPAAPLSEANARKKQADAALIEALEKAAKETNQTAEQEEANRQATQKAIDEVNAANRELAKAKKEEVDKQQRLVAKFSAGLDIAGTIGRTAGSVFGAMSSGHRLQQMIDVDIPMRGTQANIALGEIQNQRSLEQMNIATNASAWRRFRQQRAQEETKIGSFYGQATQRNLTNEINDRALSEIVGGGSEGIINAITKTVSVGTNLATAFTPHGRAAKIGLNALAIGAGIGSATTSAADLLSRNIGLAADSVALQRGIPQKEMVAQGINLERAANDTQNKMLDMFNQQIMDQQYAAMSATRGMGRGREAMFQNIASPDAIMRAAALGLRPEDLTRLATMGRDTIGGSFTAEDISRGQQYARAGVLAGPEQYLQARGMIAGAGGSKKDADDTLARAVAAGMDNSKNIMQMVEATTQISEQGAKLGIDTVSGSGALLQGIMASFKGSGLDPSAMTKAAMNTANAANAIYANRDLTPSNMMLAMATKQRFGTTDPALNKTLMELTPAELKQMQILSNRGDTKGLRELAERLKIGDIAIGPKGRLSPQFSAWMKDAAQARFLHATGETASIIPEATESEMAAFRRGEIFEKPTDVNSRRYRVWNQMNRAVLNRGSQAKPMSDALSGQNVATAGNIDLTSGSGDAAGMEQLNAGDAQMRAKAYAAADKELLKITDRLKEVTANLASFDLNKERQKVADVMGKGTDQGFMVPANTFKESTTLFSTSVVKFNEAIQEYIRFMTKDSQGINPVDMRKNSTDRKMQKGDVIGNRGG